MNARSFDNIRRSYKVIAPRLDQLTFKFYERVFTASPDVQQLFATTDMNAQRKHLAAALAMIVRNVTMLDTLEVPLHELGAAHARVGVRPEHYPLVCEAMLAAMVEAIGPAWSNELAADWRSLLETVSRHMLAGALADVR